MENTFDRLCNWWNWGDQDRPCIVMNRLSDGPTQIPQTEDLNTYWTDLDFRIRRRMAIIESTVDYGEAVPYHYIDFGASAMPGVLGARMEQVNEETIWAHPVYGSIDEVLEAPFWDTWRDGVYFRMISELTRRSTALATDHHFVTHFALGGAVDNLAALYGTENLLIDLIEQPEKVMRALLGLKQLWVEAFTAMNAIIADAGNRGGIGWAGVWAPGTTFPIQEDISYMLSPTMFREFCLPHIRDCVDAMDFPLYHLDGVGAIPHLDALLEIEALKVIQWVPGAGREDLHEWYELIAKILSAGKSCQVFARTDEIPRLIDATGSRGLLISCWDADEAQAEEVAREYHL
jgi:hypothetical protein